MRRIEKTFGKHAIAFYPSSINRPYLSFDWLDNNQAVVGFSVGNTVSDPVFTLVLELNLPSWIANRLP